MNKLFYSLSDRLDKLLEEHAELYFKERPWIDKPYEMVLHPGHTKPMRENTPHNLVDLSEERKQIELEIKKVNEKIDYLLSKPKHTETQVQELFGPFSA